MLANIFMEISNVVENMPTFLSAWRTIRILVFLLRNRPAVVSRDEFASNLVGLLSCLDSVRVAPREKNIVFSPLKMPKKICPLLNLPPSRRMQLHYTLAEQTATMDSVNSMAKPIPDRNWSFLALYAKETYQY